MKRNAAIDLLRAVMMYGIILLHTCALPELWGRGGNHAVFVLMTCVVGFVFISGYFGVRFSWRKMGALYGTALFCIGVVGAANALTGRYDQSGVALCLSDCCRIFREYWFLHGYAFLMCVAPIVDALLDREGGGGALFCPFLLLVFGWGFLTGMWGFNRIVPPLAGLTPKSGLTMTGIYIVARYYRRNEERFDRYPTGWYVGVAIVASIVASLGYGWFGAYNSPVALLNALCIFHCFRHVSLPRILGRIMIFIAPSVFSIYILTANEFVYDWVSRYLASVDMPIAVGIVSVSALLFAVALCIDFVRRFAVYGIAKVNSKRSG